ncbi:MAG: hypothetical protein H7Z42_15390 [Roseiflexaceae bacterium]|nr:hypothetical protein [Roseiflexaceae bacterium]
MTRERQGTLPRWVPWVLLAALIGVIGCALIVGLLWQLTSRADVLRSSVTTNFSDQEIEELAALKLPPSVGNLQVRYDSFLDYFIYLRFEIDAGDLPALLDSTRITQPLSPSEQPGQIFSSTIDTPPDWRPEDAQQHLAGEWNEPGSPGPDYQGLFVDTSDPQRYIVYVAAFDT